MDYVVYNGQLYHHGIKGMKWGVRRFQKKDGDLTPAGKKRYAAKEAYKQVKKEYNKAYWEADSKRHQAFSLSKKKREENDKRWDKAFDKADKLNTAKAEYKKAKSIHKAELAEQKARENAAINKKTDELRKKATLGEKLTYNDATRRLAAKYIVKNNMSVEEATRKAKGDAWRNTAAFVAVYGGVMAASIYMSNKG